MTLIPGTRLGPYEILAPLGAGGMGEVYRARDTTLGRDVALKTLPASFAGDPERLARFEREAKTLASLNHPHIAQIYGFERAGDTCALVMELVEGEDLSQRIARGALPLDEAVPIARQIAEALDAAHEQGIIHRDLKPANIKVRGDGVVKVLDFGLAKLAQPASAGSQDVTASPTITSPARMTGIGVILGTAAYMSPEQAKGREADRRSDIWAFGAVLYEMLTGRRAFDGEDMAEVLGAVVRLEPNWEALPADVPLPVRTLLQGCLVKDRGRRVADISTALFVLDKAASLTGSAATVAAAPLPRPPLWRRVVAPVAAALLAATVAGTGVWYTTRAAAPVATRPSRWQIDAALTVMDSAQHLAIAPDGSHVIYVGNRGTELFVRALDTLEPVSVFTRFPRGPFVSPDSQWIGFADAGMLKKVQVNGGPAVPITTMDGSTSRGATWGQNDTIIFATTNGGTGLQQVSAGGGPTTVLTRADSAQGEADHVWPEWLPGDQAVLFTITAATGGLEAAQVAVLDLGTGVRKVLLRGGSHARYLPSGHLIYATAGTLRAVPFDLARLETRGVPVAVIRDLLTTAAGDLDAVVSADGTLAYVPGGVARGDTRTLVWVDRQGRETPIPAPPRAYVQPRLSPDGKRVAVFTADQELDLWLSDIDRPTLTRLTSGAGVDSSPEWTRDGSALIFSSQRASAGNIFRQPANGSGAIERLSESPLSQNPTGVTPDGRSLIFGEVAEKTGEDVMQMTLDGSRAVTPLVRTSFAERNGIVSPDGRWLAYEANDSGQFEIFVRPYPDVSSGLAQVSVAGGVRPLWAPGGQELLFVSPSGAVMSARVGRGTSWAATAPSLLVKDGYYTSPGNPGRTYDISPDGQRLLMVKPSGGGSAAPASLVVVQHWLEELKRLVPTPD